ncbi:MAG: tyrosine--tRNA ligase [Kiritimatiellae bacterium]|nr:tyrosine--tRNA ligase [Kiritimatiellia bacterium]
MHNMDAERQLEIIAGRTVNLVSKEELRRKLENSIASQRPLRVKYGADPSAPDIHVGHVVALKKLREFQDLGHTVVFIIGDFTAMIGDPSGRSETRKPLAREEVTANAKTYQEQVRRILDPARTEVHFNSEWLANMTFDNVLKLSARLTVAQMLAREDFQKRFRENLPISIVEFTYPIIQGYDSVMVEADVEVGGTDQLFNLLIGRDLQKSFGCAQQVIMTLPLLEGLDGVKKMSKSLGNYIGITEPAREIFGKVMSIPDELMWRYFSLVLCRRDVEVQSLREAMAAGKRHPRELKDELAREITAMFHGRDAARAASEEFARVFSGHKLPDAIPAANIPAASLKDGKAGIVALLAAAGLAESKSAARRLVQQGAVKIEGRKITDVNAEIAVADENILQAGKRGIVRLKII